jgi:hypothetical protein
MRKVLPADPGVRGVGADQHVAGRGAAVGEERGDFAVRADLVTLEGLVEMNDAVQPLA